MRKIIALTIIGGIIALVIVVSFHASNTQSAITPNHYIEVRRGDNFTMAIPFTNNNTATEGPVDVNVSLTAPAVLSLTSYELSAPYKREGNNTVITVGRWTNSTYMIKYEDLTGKKELNVDSMSGVSFDAKIGTYVTYDSFNNIVLLEGETVEFAYTFNTIAAYNGTYDIKVAVNDNLILYRAEVRT